MEDVAAEAGCTRITLYRKFGNRAAFVLELIAFRLAAFNQRYIRRYGRPHDLSAGIQSYLLASVRAARKVPITREIIRGPMDFVETGSPLYAVMEHLWRPPLMNAQASGQLAADVSISDAIKWILIMTATLSRLTVESKLSEPNLKSLIRSFVLPGFGVIPRVD